jgi:hypothetical protein
MLALEQNAPLSAGFLCLTASGNSGLNSPRQAKRGVDQQLMTQCKGEFAEICRRALTRLAATRQIKKIAPCGESTLTEFPKIDRQDFIWQ